MLNDRDKSKEYVLKTTRDKDITRLAFSEDMDYDGIYNNTMDSELEGFYWLRTNGRLSLTFNIPITLTRGTTRSYFVTIDVSEDAVEFSTLGLKVHNSNSIIIETGIVSFIPSQIGGHAARLSYIGHSLPEKIIIDGAFVFF